MIIRKAKRVEKPAIVIYRRNSFKGCEPLKSWKLYTSSESRFFKFLMDIKRGKRFDEFKVCVFD